MKTINFRILLLLAAGLLIGITTNAQSLTDSDSKKAKHEKKTKEFIEKTNNILLTTANKVRKNKVYTGYLHKANKKQEKANEFFSEQKFRQAIKNSYLSRRYAFLAFRANKGKVHAKWRLTEKEKVKMKKIFKKEVTNKELKSKVTDKERATEQNEIK